MSEESHKKILRIVKGAEQRVCAINDIRCKLSIMYPAYCEARLALKEIIELTDSFYKETEYFSDDEMDTFLFQYSSNIIAFIAPRGGGKTRAMLSFSEILQNSKRKVVCLQEKCGFHCSEELFEDEEDAHFNNCYFEVLPPIAPATLEGSQNILYVILSRLYRHAERILEEDRNRGRIKEKDRNALYYAFQRCLSGINGIKRPSKDITENITDLQYIADGLSLRKHFFDLIKQILKISGPSTHIQKKFLILQLDDADSQNTSGYEVLEDVRKYLLLPNLVILFSTEEGNLRRVVLQGELRCFKDVVSQRELEASTIADLTVSTKKYIDKLIPASHAIYLPKLEKIIDINSDRMELQYLSADGSKNMLPWATGDGWSLQNTLLTMIYRKTGVLFVGYDSYLHNIIPRTMRGFNQLIQLLSTMEDIPDPFKDSNDSLHGTELGRQILRQIAVAEQNLRIFTNYFEHNWIESKISSEDDRIFLKDLYNTSAANHVRRTIKYLSKKYTVSFKTAIPFSRFHLEKKMREIELEHRTLDDFHLLFAIRTIFTLESHRLILWQKRIAVENYLKEQPSAGRQVLLYDLTPERIGVPCYYFTGSQLGNWEIMDFVPPKNDLGTIEMTIRLERNLPKRQNYFVLSMGDSGYFSLMNYIICWLHIDKFKGTEESLKQVDLLALQEYALTVAANWDVQKTMYNKMWELGKWDNASHMSLAQTLRKLVASGNAVLFNSNICKTIEQNSLLNHFHTNLDNILIDKSATWANMVKKAMDDVYQLVSTDPHIQSESASNKDAAQIDSMETTAYSSPVDSEGNHNKQLEEQPSNDSQAGNTSDLEKGISQLEIQDSPTLCSLPAEVADGPSEEQLGLDDASDSK